VPAGNGRESGRWTSGDGSSEAENASDTNRPLQTGRSVSSEGGRSDPQGRGSLRITASDQPDFTVTLSFSF
jgi:hypothetical protein